MLERYKFLWRVGKYLESGQTLLVCLFSVARVQGAHDEVGCFRAGDDHLSLESFWENVRFDEMQFESA